MRPLAAALAACLGLCLPSPAAAIRAQLSWSAIDSTATDLTTPGDASSLYILLTSGVTSFKGAEVDLLWEPPGDGAACAAHLSSIYNTSTTCTYLNRGAAVEVETADEPGHLHVAWANPTAETDCSSGAIAQLQFDFTGCADARTRFKICSLIIVDANGLVHDVASYGVPATVLGGGEGSPPCNNPPVIEPYLAQVVRPGDLITVVPSTHDPDNDVLTFALLDPLPAGAMFDPVTGVFSWRPDASQLGAYMLTVRVTDSHGATDETDLTVTVAGPNHPPVLASIPDASVSEGDRLEIPLAVYDPDGDPVTLSISTGYPPGSEIVYVGNEPRFQWTPGPLDAGHYPNVTIQARDSYGGLAEQSFDITVLDTPDKVRAQLTWSAGDSMATDLADAGPSATLYVLLTSGVTSFKGAEIDLLWEPTGDGAACLGHVATAYPTSDDCSSLNRGTAVPIVVADEPGHLHLAWANSAAVTSCTGGVILELAFDLSQCSDPTARFKICSLLIVDASNETTPASNYGVPATVRGGGNFAPPCNSPPQILPMPLQVVVSGDSLSAVASANDPDNDVLAYSILEALPAGATFDAAAGLFAWRPLADNSQQGTYAFTVRVTDAHGASDETALTVTVLRSSVNHAPVLEAIGDQHVDEAQLLDVALTVSDTDGDVVQVAVVNGYPPGASISVATGEPHFLWTPGPTDAGVYPGVTLEASDGRGGTATQSFTIEVLATNQGPTIEVGERYRIDEGYLFSIQFQGDDPEGDSLAFSLASITPDPPGRVLPAVVTLSAAVGRISWTPTYLDGQTTYTITVQAQDPSGAVGQASFDLDTHNVNGPPHIVQQADTTVTEAVVSEIRLVAREPDGENMLWRLADPVPPWASLRSAEGPTNRLVLRPGYASAESLGSAGTGKDSIKVMVRSGVGVNQRRTQMVFILTIQDAGAALEVELPLAPARAKEETEAVPHRAEAIARPNPFGAALTVEYGVPTDAPVSLAVYDAAGRRIRTLVSAPCSAGWHETRWDGRLEGGQEAPAGTYYLRGRIGSDRVAARLVRAP